MVKGVFFILCACLISAWLQKHSCISVLDSLKHTIADPLISVKRARFGKEWYYSTDSYSDADGKEPPKALVLSFSQITDDFKQLLKKRFLNVNVKKKKRNVFFVLHCFVWHSSL